MKLLHVDGHRIVLARTDTGFTAFDDHCTHRGASLADGVMLCGAVQCPWHGSQFDAHTGAVKAGPAKKEIAVYDVELRGSEVLLHVAARTRGARSSARVESAPGPAAR
jgi:nitrite reductase/ring-hydroxylating ferredoxin subunit